MKTIFDKATRDELIARINTLNADSKPQWGTMNVYQMLKHCSLAEDFYQGKMSHKRVFLGRIIGQWALKDMLKDDAPMRRNAPTSDKFKVSEITGDIETEKKNFIDHLNAYANFNTPQIIHWFFGKMTMEQVGQFVYKHTDHHLRQFNS